MGMGAKDRANRLRTIEGRDGPNCHYCTELPTHVTLDHVVPVSLDGPDYPDNLVLSCHGCNSLRGATPYEHFATTNGLPRTVIEATLSRAERAMQIRRAAPRPSQPKERRERASKQERPALHPAGEVLHQRETHLQILRDDKRSGPSRRPSTEPR